MPAGLFFQPDITLLSPRVVLSCDKMVAAGQLCGGLTGPTKNDCTSPHEINYKPLTDKLDGIRLQGGLSSRQIANTCWSDCLWQPNCNTSISVSLSHSTCLSRRVHPHSYMPIPIAQLPRHGPTCSLRCA